MTTPYVPHLIAPARIGVELDLQPWLVPEDAYVDIQNGYNYLGTIYKREGYTYFDSIPHALSGSYHNIASISGTGSPNIAITLKANHGLTGTPLIRLTGIIGLTPLTGELPIDGTQWTATITSPTSFTINNLIGYSGSANFSNGTASNFPGLPVMMIANYIVAGTNSFQIVVCDTRRGAYFDNVAQTLTPIGFADQFTGDFTNLFWWENFTTSVSGDTNLFITNKVDTMFRWDGTQAATGFDAFTPKYDGSNEVTRCLMIKGINQRLCLFNTVEGGTTHTIRIRWCAQDSDPLQDASWNELTFNGGANFDLVDSTYIISFAQIQFSGLVFAQGQQLGLIYEMRPINTGNSANAFIFTKIANSRNVNSTFGTIIYDRQVTAVGNIGLVSTDGNTVARIDDKIPEFAINDIDQLAINQCYGLRNDTFWQGWVLYPSATSNENGKNTNILVYNYKDGSWAFHSIPLVCLGLSPNPNPESTWESYNDSVTWESFDDSETWVSQSQSKALLLYGGDYFGNIWNMNRGGSDGAYPVTQQNIAGSPITFSLTSRQWTPFMNEGASSEWGYVDFLIDADPSTIVLASFFVDNNQAPYKQTYFTCVPYENLTGGPINFVSNSNPALVTSNQHGLITGIVIYIYAVQGMNELNGASFTVTVTDLDHFSLNGVDSSAFTPYQANGVFSLNPIEQSPFWTRVYIGQTGVFHQMQLETTGINQGFALHAVCPYFKKVGNRLFKG